jgi:hypothetical protein
VGFWVEEFDGAFCELALDGLYAGVGLVLGGFGAVVVEVGGKLILWSHVIMAL